MAKARKLKDLTPKMFIMLLGKHRGRVADVASELGVTSSALYYWMKAHACKRTYQVDCTQGQPQ